MNDSITSEIRAELSAMARNGQVWLVLVAAGLLIGLTGPFGTFDTLPLPGRIAYWGPVVVVSYAIGFTVSFVVTSLVETRAGPRIGAGVGAAAASLVVTAWLAGLHSVLFAAPFWAEARDLLPYVFVIALVASVLAELVERRTTAPAPAQAPLADAPDWLSQLPADLGRDLILLQAQDHYLSVETTLGSTLIRARLSDAAEALGPYGLRIHRSWWVAHHAIQALEYHNGGPVMVLKDGRHVPVGRTYRRRIREALY